MKKEIGRNIALFGTRQEIEKAENVINALTLPETSPGPFAKNEDKIRLILQQAIDDYGLKATVMFCGNTIVPYKKTLKEFNKHKKSGTLDGMSNYFYNFLHSVCNDIAHYNKMGYIDFYGNDFKRVIKEVINQTKAPYWRTDLKRVLDAIKTT